MLAPTAASTTIPERYRAIWRSPRLLFQGLPGRVAAGERFQFRCSVLSVGIAEPGEADDRKIPQWSADAVGQSQALLQPAQDGEPL